jgi:hypothetical protein
MKKVKLYPTLALSFILSSLAVTSSALEETFTYGTRPTTWSGVPITGAGDALRTGGSSNGGSSYTPPEARAAIAAQQKAAYEGQKAYCKANNYPTNVPFCAGFKAQETQNCKITANATKLQCQIDYNRAHTNELISCGKVFFSDNLLSQCNRAADSQLVGDLLSCDLSFDTTVSKC